MQYRTLGNSNLQVSALGLGCMSLSGTYGKSNDAESIAVVHYSPLGRSVLTGSVQTPDDIPPEDRRRDHPRFQGENLSRNLELLRHVEAIARDKRCTTGQLVLAWLLAQGPDVVPIPGTKRASRLEENVGAVDVVLDPDDVRRIAEAVPAGAAAGTRYPEAMMRALYL